MEAFCRNFEVKKILFLCYILTYSIPRWALAFFTIIHINLFPFPFQFIIVLYTLFTYLRFASYNFQYLVIQDPLSHDPVVIRFIYTHTMRAAILP